ncbi:MAG TPA: T9SS type A sorting domain-containing protein [Saprospiraceae bacterium]|nr:T9SS type A sorting domain-containing protein [Lewinellaceae bacterium]HPK09894.1 T9SS type A sorting domain-containing protein [Saprospiraceae bacterium]
MKKLFIISLISLMVLDITAQCEIKDYKISNHITSKTIYTQGEVDEQGSLYYLDGEVVTSYSVYQWITIASKSLTDTLYTGNLGSDYNYLPGPLNRQNFEPLDSSCYFFNKIWIIHNSEIVNLKHLFTEGIIKVEDIPEDILYWPARGNPYINTDYGFDISFDLAPFYDHDLDGKYDPLNGDYPIALIEREDYLPSVFTYTVFHQNVLSTMGILTPVEISFIHFFEECLDNERPVMFYRIGIENLNADETIQDARLGFYTMNEVGCVLGNSEYSGCDTISDTYYYYNKDGMDPPKCPRVPTQQDLDAGIYYANVCLNSKMIGFKSLNSNSGLRTLLASIWSNNYDYYDLPNLPNGNSMQNDTPSNPYTFPMASYSIPPIEGRKRVNIDFADYVIYDTLQRNLNVFNTFREDVNYVENTYASIMDGSLNCDDVTYCIDDCVWPGDVNDDGIVEGIDFIVGGLVTLFPKIKETYRPYGSEFWVGQDSENWQFDFNQLNGKYLDCNGDGYISRVDFERTIWNNMYKTNSKYNPLPESTIDGENGIYSIQESINKKIYKVKVKYGNDEGQVYRPLHGVCINFEVEHPDYFKYIFPMFQLNNVNHFDHVDEKAVQISLSNTKLIDIDTSTQLFSFLLILKDSITTVNTDGRDTIDINFTRAKGIDLEGTLFDIPISDIQLVLSELIVDFGSKTVEVSDYPLNIYPNPSTGLFTLDTEYRGEVEVYDMLGNVVWKGEKKTQTTSINLGTLRRGLYFMRVGNSMKKIILSH